MTTQSQVLPNDSVQLGGFFRVEVIRDTPEGPKVIHRQEVHNLVVTVGKKQLWAKVTATNTHFWKYFRIGTCGATGASNMTNVLSPITGTLKTCNSIGLSGATRTFHWMYSYPSGAGSKSATGIKEVVLADQITSPGGSILARAVLSAVNKTTADKLKIVYAARIS